ncbi:hypothetical protein VIAE109791_17675 [Vibrio aestuarianus subsp. francensis]
MSVGVGVGVGGRWCVLVLIGYSVIKFTIDSSVK